MPTEMELTLEQTQQGVSYEVSVDPHGFEDGGGDFRYSDTERLSRSDEVLKLKNFKKDATLKLFKLSIQESVGAENLRRIGQEKVQHGCNVDTSRDTNHQSSNLLNFPIFSATNEFSSICEQDVDLEKEEAEVEDDDDGDTYDIWDITSILDELLEEFDEEIANVTMVDEESAKDP
ncbi:hypothetical protein Tco_1501507 [Tanacetum coccineum]